MSLGKERIAQKAKVPEPLISVVLVCYNQARYLKEAFATIEAQSYKNIEVIAVDDASSDGSLEVLQLIRSQSNLAIKVFGAPGGINHGIVATYTKGISEAKADYVAFLEADDAWSPNYLARKMSVLERFPEVGVVFSPCRIVRQGTFGLDMQVRQVLIQLLLPRNKPFKNFERLLWKNNVANFSCFVTRTGIVRRIPAPDSTRVSFYDWWLLAHLSIHNSFFFETRSYTRWRFSRTSLMGKQTFEAHAEQLTSFLGLLYKSLEERLTYDKIVLQTMLRQKYRGARPFMEFYRQPSFYRWLYFFGKSPIWALKTLVSYSVNKLKFG
jgi:glycosyltransferase involved in cell wall biosynthesis